MSAKKLVECVPNISEGRDRAVIEQVAAVIEKVEGVRLLDVDPGADTNRTVITFIGSPEGVEEAAFRVVEKAAELIDMSHHSGAHPRHGATDVCPFVPVRGVTMEECVEVARRVGLRIGKELAIPVYLYEEAAQYPERKNLAHVRRGEYEALAGKLGQEEWKPDYGPNEFTPRVARAGATNVGARRFLVAFNVNLNTRSRKLAHDIALDVREAGRAKRDERGEIVRDADGRVVKVPGTLKAVKGVGWSIPEYDRAQISMNLVDTSITKPHEAFEEVRAQARKRGVRATGSELVGLIPEEDLLEAGRYYLRRAGQSAGAPRRQLIETAIQSLGLRELGAFDPTEKVIEYQAGLVDGRLIKMTNREFVDELSTDSPAPGGGSVAALSAAHAAGLGAMVANLTVGRKGYEAVQDKVKAIAEACQADKDFLLAAVDEDTDAFDRVMEAFRLPKKTDEQKKTRNQAVIVATRGATLVPLRVLERLPELAGRIAELVEIGNKNSRSDAGVAALTVLSGAEGAYLNVLTNLAALEERGASDPEIRRRADAALAGTEHHARQARQSIRAALA